MILFVSARCRKNNFHRSLDLYQLDGGSGGPFLNVLSVDVLLFCGKSGSS